MLSQPGEAVMFGIQFLRARRGILGETRQSTGLRQASAATVAEFQGLVAPKNANLTSTLFSSPQYKIGSIQQVHSSS